MKFVLSLALAFALFGVAVSGAGAQWIPGGSYQQSCVNIRANGDTLFAQCTAPNGQYVSSALNIGSCRGGDIANRNGFLHCNYNGGGGYRVPAGSYQQSCVNVRVEGNLLYASCTAPNGQYVRSSLVLGSCRGDIANGNGYLRCNGGGYAPPGYPGGEPPAPGSYLSSCRNVTRYGDVLSAQCTASNGAWVNSSLRLHRCFPGTDIANINGRLECLAYR